MKSIKLADLHVLRHAFGMVGLMSKNLISSRFRHVSGNITVTIVFIAEKENEHKYRITPKIFRCY